MKRVALLSLGVVILLLAAMPVAWADCTAADPAFIQADRRNLSWGGARQARDARQKKKAAGAAPPAKAPEKATRKPAESAGTPKAKPEAAPQPVPKKTR